MEQSNKKHKIENPLPAPDSHQKMYLNYCIENVIHHGTGLVFLQKQQKHSLKSLRALLGSTSVNKEVALNLTVAPKMTISML